MSVLTIGNRDDFNRIVKDSFSLVDFYADWCGPCRSMSPIIDNLATEFIGKVNVLKVNIDVLPDLATDFGVSSIPTLIFIKNGSEIARKNGLARLDVIKEWILKEMGDN